MSIVKQLAALGASPEMIRGSLCNGRPISECERTTSNTVTAGRFESAGVLRIVVPGPAPGKPRQTRSDRWRQRPCVMRYREWADLVRSVAGDVPPADSVEELRLTAYFEPPKSWSKRARCDAIQYGRHPSRPDVDNIAKAAMDTLWPDNDSGISDVYVRKRWDWNARLEIEIVLNGGAT